MCDEREKAVIEQVLAGRVLPTCYAWFARRGRASVWPEARRRTSGRISGTGSRSTQPPENRRLTRVCGQRHGIARRGTVVVVRAI